MRVRHRKRKTTYTVLGKAEAQVAKLGRSDFPASGRIILEGDLLVVYQCETTGKLWIRFEDEFEDGRFEVLSE